MKNGKLFPCFFEKCVMICHVLITQYARNNSYVKIVTKYGTNISNFDRYRVNRLIYATYHRNHDLEYFLFRDQYWRQMLLIVKEFTSRT